MYDEIANFESDDASKRVSQLVIKGATSQINAKGTIVVLCAGTVYTPTIVLNSVTDEFKSSNLIGKGLTDHEIWMTKYWKNVSESHMMHQPLELSCHVKVHGHEALLTVCTHAEKFYSHRFATGEGRPADDDPVSVLNIMLEFEATLNEDGKVTADAEGRPLLSINRTLLDDSDTFKSELTRLNKSIRNSLGFSAVDNPALKDNPKLAAWGSDAQ